MFLKPRIKKYKKEKRGKICGVSFEFLNYGSFGIQAQGFGQITARQIETARRIISRRIKNSGKLWIRIFPSKPITKKPNEVRMGKGKGNVAFWVAPVRPGKILYEIEGVSNNVANKIFKSMSSKLPVKVCLISKNLSFK